MKPKKISVIYAIYLHVSYWIQVWRAARGLGVTVPLGEVILSLHPAAQNFLQEFREHQKSQRALVTKRSLN